MYIKNKRGQSTVEYILLVTAVVAVMVVFVTGQKSGFQSQLNSTLNTATSDMNSLAGTLAASHAGTGVSGDGEPTGISVNVIPTATTPTKGG